MIFVERLRGKNTVYGGVPEEHPEGVYLTVFYHTLVSFTAMSDK